MFGTADGSTKFNVKKGTANDIVRGQMNIPLTPEGRREAEEDGNRLAEAGIVELYASPLSRTLHTAQQVGKHYGLKPRPARELLPWDMGDLTGTNARLAKPILRRYAEEEPKRRVPGGESFSQWRQRLLGFIQKLMKHVEQRGVTACCVSHSRCIKMLEGWMDAGGEGLAIDFDVMFTDNTEPGSIYELKPDEKGHWADRRILKGYTQG